MHEYSLARSIVREVIRTRQERRLGPVQAVTLELGEFSGVEPVLLKSAFTELSEEYLGRRVPLEIDLVPLEARCSLCDRRFQVVNFEFVCPDCGECDVHVLRGEELKLVSILAESSESEACL